MITWLLAYLIAGMTHYLRLVRAATHIQGDLGAVLRAHIRRPKIGTFVGVIVSWPVVAYSGLRAGTFRSGLEVITFIGAGLLLSWAAA